MKESWVPRVVATDEECVGESKSSKRKCAVAGSRKKPRLKEEVELAWGEVGSAEEEERRTFLYSELAPQINIPHRQRAIRLLSGKEWMCNMIVRDPRVCGGLGCGPRIMGILGTIPASMRQKDPLAREKTVENAR